MTLVGHWPCAAARAAAGGGWPPRLAGKSNYFQNFSKNTELKISMSRVNFIPEAKVNLAWKNSNFTKIHADPRIG